MSPVFRYGLLAGVAAAILLILAPQPQGAVAAFALVAAQLLAGAAILWRRTGLKYATASLITGAAGAALIAYLFAAGLELFSLSAAPVAAAVLLIAGPVLFAVEARANPAKWRAWREQVENASVVDLLRGRHIPHLR
ncbi:MAG: hypothetical protein KY467_17845 [Gemmatimonadetes bacterium]|nr:hypothetical protein [Gemmatimonadota bacterium]